MKGSSHSGYTSRRVLYFLWRENFKVHVLFEFINLGSTSHWNDKLYTLNQWTTGLWEFTD